jgi:uncharacterized RmlC-like cupin family protein
MGETHVLPETVSGNHQEVRVVTAPGDCIFVPPYVPHREENPDTQEAIVVNLKELYALSGSAD